MPFNIIHWLADGTKTIVESVATSAGAADANKIVETDAAGIIDSSFFPPGLLETAEVETEVALAAGDFVNIYDNTGEKVRLAVATSIDTVAVGFVLSAYNIGDTATVYLAGTNTSVTVTPNEVYYLSSTTPGGIELTPPPVAAGNVSQQLGRGRTEGLRYELDEPILLA